MTYIYVHQKTWAFTTSDSEKPEIKTGGFGPCYVATFTAEKNGRKFAAMAHIDTTTTVESMDAIFKKFLENSVDLKDVKVVVLGGWKEEKASFNWGNKIVERISKAGFENISTKNMHTKKELSFQKMQGMSKIDNTNHYHFGARVEATTGKTFLLKEESHEMQKEKLSGFVQFLQNGLNKETPLTQIF